MRSHRRTYSASSESQGLVWLVVVVFLLGGGAVLYFVMGRSTEPTPRVLTAGARGPVASAATAATAPAEVPPGVVEEQYQVDLDRFKVVVRGMFLEESVSDRWRLEVAWWTPGRAKQRPTKIGWLVVHSGPERLLRYDDVIDLRFDGVQVQTGDPSYGHSSGVETLRFTTSLDDFLAVPSTKRITLQTGAKEWELTAETLQNLRALTERVPRADR